MDRRTFLASLIACAATPALPSILPEGFSMEGDTLYIRGLHFDLDGPLEVPGLARKVVVEACTFYYPNGSAFITVSDDSRIDFLTFKDCQFSPRLKDNFNREDAVFYSLDWTCFYPH